MLNTSATLPAAVATALVVLEHFRYKARPDGFDPAIHEPPELEPKEAKVRRAALQLLDRYLSDARPVDAIAATPATRTPLSVTVTH